MIVYTEEVDGETWLTALTDEGEWIFGWIFNRGIGLDVRNPQVDRAIRCFSRAEDNGVSF